MPSGNEIRLVLIALLDFLTVLKGNEKREYAFYGMDRMDSSKALVVELYHLDVCWALQRNGSGLTRRT